MPMRSRRRLSWRVKVLDDAPLLRSPTRFMACRSAPLPQAACEMVVLRRILQIRLVAVQTPQGFDRETIVRAHALASPGVPVTDDAGLAEHPEVAALVLGAATEGNPGPLVTHFSAHAGNLRCPLFIVPGGLGEERIDELS